METRICGSDEFAKTEDDPYFFRTDLVDRAENENKNDDDSNNDPDDVSFEEAVFIEPVALASKSITLTKPIKGENVLVLGQGLLGLLHTQFFKKVGTNCFRTLSS